MHLDIIRKHFFAKILRFYFGNTLSEVSQKFQMLSSKAVKKERKKYVKYMHQRWRGLEKEVGVGSDDTQAGGKENVTHGAKQSPSVARYDTFIVRKAEVQAWHSDTVRSVALLGFQASWATEGSLSGKATGSSLYSTEKSISQWSSSVRKSVVTDCSHKLFLQNNARGYFFHCL